MPLLLSLLLMAHAYDLVQGEVWPVDAPVRDVLLTDADADGGADLLVAHEQGITVFLSDHSASGISADLCDLAQSQGAVFACGADGLFRLSIDPEPTLIALDDRVCQALAAGDINDDGAVDLLTIDSAALLWPGTSEGDFEGPNDDGLRVKGTPLAVALSDAFVIAEINGDTLTELTLRDLQTHDIDGPLGGLASLGDQAAWTLPDPGLLVLADGASLNLGLGAGPMAAFDLQGDHVPELAVITDDGVVVVSDLDDSPTVLAQFDLDTSGALAIAMGDVTLDGCPDVVLGRGGELLILQGTDCDWPSPDADGDGWTVADGDCDDANATTHPGAIEDCNGDDDDCDGDIDEVDLLLDTPVPIDDEGATLIIDATPAGCWDALDWSLPSNTAQAECDPSIDSLSLSCDMLDEGRVAVQARLLLDDTIVATASATLETRNAPPRILTPAEDATVSTEASIRNTLAMRLRAIDPGVLDTQEWSLEGGPPGMSVSQSGLIEYVGVDDDLGEWLVRVTVRDGDGGSDSDTFTLEVNAPMDTEGTDQGSCCCGSTAGVLFPVFLLGVRGRRRLLG